jgi:hypothetical protein
VQQVNMTVTPDLASGSGSETGKFSQAEFNAWVIGGHYTKNKLKRGQLVVQAKLDGDALEAHRNSLENRKVRLREELESHQLAYNGKVPDAMRSVRASSPPRERHAPQDHTPRSRGHSREAEQHTAPQDNDENSSNALRGRLKASFAQISATHAYGTLFPPLLTPYSRSCLLGQNSTPKSPHQENQIPDALKSAPRRTSSSNPLSVVAGERKRAQPGSGPKAFFPSSSNSSIYRHFMHIPPTDRATFAKGA